MAQDRADYTPTPAISLDSEADVELEEGSDVPPPASMASIDKLLALTDEGWDIDDQVRTLKDAAEQRPSSLPKPPSRRAESLRLPTPYEIGPLAVPGQKPGSPSAHPPLPRPSLRVDSPTATVQREAPGRKPTSIPPPLPPSIGGSPTGTVRLPPPPAIRSKAPPPLPRPPEPSRPPPSQRTSAPPPPPADVVAAPPGTLLELLIARAGALHESSDRVGLARVHMELSIAHELEGDEGRALTYAEAALKVDPDLAPAHAFLRRRKHGRGALPAMLGHLDHELASTTSDEAKVQLLVERARLLDAMGERPEVLRATWVQALAHAPQHAAALRGLDGELMTRASQPGAPADLLETWAAHLGHMADTYTGDKPLAAWLHVERAQILEKRLGRLDAARGALERALELDPRVGPVRGALVRHVSSRGDAPALVALLDQEALIETDPARSARLELEAAAIAATRLADPKRAALLLTRAAARAPTTPSVDRRVLDDLIRIREAEGNWGEAAQARRARLRFLAQPAFLVHELRALAGLAERSGELETAIADVQRALSLDGSDVTIVELLDRLLATAGKDDQRVALWLTEAARADEGPRRARSLIRAAAICEDKLGRTGDAIRHLRTAWTAVPGDPEVLDALTRLVKPTVPEASAAEARTLIELYAQAVETTRDRQRKIAYLEKIALLWEDVLGDARRAIKAYEDILKLDPDRRSAILGLARSAARARDDRTVARALLEEARLAEDGVDVLALRTRAATVLAHHDPARALSLVTDVLGQEPAHLAARALATRLHEEAGRWELAAHSLRARLDHTAKPDRMPLLLALAHLEETRLKAPLDALATLQKARGIDPHHPMPPDSIARILENISDATTVRGAFEGLAADSQSPDERAYYLVRAAEIDELRLGDDIRAAGLYARALAETPTDDMVADRLLRVSARRALAAKTGAAPAPRESITPAAAPGKSSRPPTPSVIPPHEGAAPRGYGELVSILSKRVDREDAPALAREAAFELALLLSEPGGDVPRATSLLEDILSEDPAHAPALRTLEALMRRSSSWSLLARVLDRQAEASRDKRARLGALWSLVALEEWRLPVTTPAETYRRILELDPSDTCALDATVRREMSAARRGEPEAQKATVIALRAIADSSSDANARMATQLRLALLLEHIADTADDAGAAHAVHAAREALDLYRRVMDADALSVTATTGMARLAGRLNDAASAVRAAMSLADLSTDPKVRARYLIDAAELLIAESGDASLGSSLDRSDRAAGLLERALEADPDSLLAAERLATLRLERQQGSRMVDTFRAALRGAHAEETIIFLGTEVAKVARDEIRDLTLAIDAMRRVREAAPHHVPSLLMLAELCIAQRAWPEAVDALEAVTPSGGEAGPRLTALFALASIYEKVLSRPVDMERVLRTALEVDPQNPRALRGLLRRLTAKPAAGDERQPDQAEIASLLTRLADVEHDPEQKSELLMQVGELMVGLGDRDAAERALIEAVAQAPHNNKAFARLAAVCRESHAQKGPDPIRYARALNTLLQRGTQLGHVDARWLATLGQLEIHSLNRLREGVVHLQRAVQMAPTLYETRFELASAYSKIGAHDEATRALVGLITPDSNPILRVSDPGQALLLLERTLGQEQRAEEALVACELRAISGEIDEGRLAWLRSRRLGPVDPHHGQLDRATLASHVVPPEGQHPLLEVAGAVLGIEAKVLRSDLSELGLSSRDRVSARGGNATRALLDRVARSFAVSGVELVITPAVQKVRVLAQDEPWVVVPRAFVDLPEPAQVAGLARAVARVALGVPWLEELLPAPLLSYLVAAARVVVPGYGADELDVLTAKAVQQYEHPVAKAISRKQRRMLEEIAPHLTAHAARLPAADTFVSALQRADLRAAYLICGDLLAAVDEVRQYDAGLQAAERSGQRLLASVLLHPLAGDVCRYALSSEATALRRRVGSVWT